MTAQTAPADRQPKGDHNRRLSLGLDPDQFAIAAGVSVEALRDYESTGPDHDFDLVVAAKVGEALVRLEQVIPNSEATGVGLSLNGRTREDVLAQDAFDQSIRDTAYLLWEADGRPDGRDQEYWYRVQSGTQPIAENTAPNDETTERAFEASRKIGLQREFKKGQDDNVSGGFNQKRSPDVEPIEARTGRQMDDNIDDLGRPAGRQ